jgi:sialate O-acetylesterase
MAVTIDVGDPLDIHPRDKKSVGRRLALQALAATYGKSLQASGPAYRNIEHRAEKLIVQFEHADGLATSDGQPPKGFSLAGADRRFFAAQAAIEGNSVVLSSGNVAAPVAVRYAWADSPVTNLRNAAGLPAMPFRSDSWTEIQPSP